MRDGLQYGIFDPRLVVVARAGRDARCQWINQREAGCSR
jgi:hypothetical protein